VSAAAVLARAAAAGIRFRLRPDGRVQVEADAPPPPALLAELRRCRDELAALLAEREGRPAREATPPAAPAPDAVEVEAQVRELLRFASETAGEALAPPDPAEVEALVTYARNAAAELRAARLDEDAAALARELRAFAEEAFSALAAPDAEREQERAVLAEHYAAPPTDRPYVPTDRDDLRNGLAASAGARVPSGRVGMPVAKPRQRSSGKPKKPSYHAGTARRPIPPGGRPEGEVGPAGDGSEAEFRRG